MNGALDDQRQAAEAELVALTAPIRAQADVVRDVEVTADSMAEYVALLEHGTDRCPHLVEVPIQPTMVLLGHGYAVSDCMDCFTARRGRVRECTECGQAQRPLNRVMIPVGHRVVVSLLCDGCFDRVEASP